MKERVKGEVDHWHRPASAKSNTKYKKAKLYTSMVNQLSDTQNNILTGCGVGENHRWLLFRETNKCKGRDVVTGRPSLTVIITSQTPKTKNRSAPMGNFTPLENIYCIILYTNVMATRLFFF